MPKYTINTKLFGKIKADTEDGMCEYYDITLGGRDMNTSLMIFEDTLNDDTLKIVSDLIEHVPEMYEKGKSELMKKRDSDATVKFFIEWHLDELQEEVLEIFDVSSVKEITSDLFIDELYLRNITIAETKDGWIDCTMDFSLPDEYSDELLVVRFDEKYEIYDISHES